MWQRFYQHWNDFEDSFWFQWFVLPYWRLRFWVRGLCYQAKTWSRRRQWDREVDHLRAEPEKVIPTNSHYCYGDKGLPCEFWRRARDLPEQSSGYCALLRWGDWQGFGLLWDQVKVCDINYPDYSQYYRGDEPPPQSDVL